MTCRKDYVAIMRLSGNKLKESCLKILFSFFEL